MVGPETIWLRSDLRWISGENGAPEDEDIVLPKRRSKDERRVNERLLGLENDEDEAIVVLKYGQRSRAVMEELSKRLLLQRTMAIDTTVKTLV